MRLNYVPKRIISLVPSQTELLADLGLVAHIVGVTKFCVHPKGLKQSVAIVGGTKQVHLDVIATLKPDVILCNKEENTLDMVKALKPIAPVHISDIVTLNDALQLIFTYGKLFDVENKALNIYSAIIKAQNSFKKNQNISDKPPLKVAYFIWKSPWMVAASNTFIHTMLLDAGFRNVFSDKQRYPEINLDSETLQNADVIMLSSEPYPFKENHCKLLKHKFSNTKVITVNGELFSWYGSRLLKSYPYFKTLHQCL